jgi:hypothetical protein
MLHADEVLGRFCRSKSELINAQGAIDYANCDAKADVVLDGVVLVKQAPVTFLLFLEKQLTDLATFVGSLPVLDEAEVWDTDPNSGSFRTGVTSNHKTKRIKRPLILAPATVEHPAQTALIDEDVLVGYWDQVKLSGALLLPKKQMYLEKIDRMQQAVKMAREEANSVEAPSQDFSGAMWNYLIQSP